MRCNNCPYKILVEEIRKTAEIVVHHGSDVMDTCKFRETFSKLAESILKKCKEI